MKSDWEYVHKEIHKGDPMEVIVFIRDLNLGRMSVTNDAEAVFEACQKAHGRCRVIYKDSEDEWWEIAQAAGWSPGEWRIVFRPWHGMVWDKLTKV